MHYSMLVRVANEEEKQLQTKSPPATSTAPPLNTSPPLPPNNSRRLLGRTSLLPPRSKPKKDLTYQAQDIMESTFQDDWSLTFPDDLQNFFTSTPPLPPYSSNKALAAKRGSSSGKIASTDVASVGNASDTSVRVHSHTFSGRDLHETAKYHLNKRSYEKALECFEAILQAQSARFGPVHPSVGAALHNVGVCRQRMQQHDLAANLFQEAVQIRKQTCSQLEVAASLAKLGLAQASLGQTEQAFTSLRQALAISRQELGPSKTTAQMLCHLGCFYFETKELFAAQATFQDAYEMYQQVWHQSADKQACLTQMVDTLCNIGSIQNRRKRYNDGIVTFQQALDLIQDDYKKVATLDNLAYSYSKIKDYSNALKCYQQMLRLQQGLCTSFSEDCMETFRKQVLMHEKLKTNPMETIQETLRLAKSKGASEKVINQIKHMLDKHRKL